MLPERRATRAAVLTILFAPAIAAVIAVAALILLRDRISLSMFYETRGAILFAHQIAGAGVASVASLRLPLRRYRVTTAAAVFVLAAMFDAVIFSAVATLAAELGVRAN